MSDDSDNSLPLPHSPANGSDDLQLNTGPTHQPKKIILQLSPDGVGKPTNVPLPPLEEIPYPGDMLEKVDHTLETEIPLPPDSSDSKYSPSQASAEDASPVSETMQKKTVAVLGRAQAKKRLQAFSAARIAATSTSSVKKSPLKGVSVFSGKSGGQSNQPALAIQAIKDEETRMREILTMNTLISEKLKTAHPIGGSTNLSGPATAIVKPTLLNPELRAASNSLLTPELDKSDLLNKNSGEDTKITSFHVKKQLKNIRRKRASSSSSASKSGSHSRSKSPVIKRRGNDRRSRSRGRDYERDRSDKGDHRQRDRERDRDRDRTKDRDRDSRKKSKRSRSRSKNRDSNRRRSKSPRSKDKPRKRSRSRSRERKKRSKSRERRRSPSRSYSREQEVSSKTKDKSSPVRENKRRVSPSPVREKNHHSPSPIPLQKSRSRSLSKDNHKRSSRSRSESMDVVKKKSRSRSRDREGKCSRRKSPKHKKKDKDRDRDREKDKERQLEKERREKEQKREAELRRKEKERQEALERELDKVRTTRMPVDWMEYKKYQYSLENIREVWSAILPKESKGRSRSRSSSSSPARAPKETSNGSSSCFSRTLTQAPQLIKTVPVELKSNLKGEYPVSFLRTTKHKPSLEFGCNRLSVQGYYKSRDHVFKEEDPEVVKLMADIISSDHTSRVVPSDRPRVQVQSWFTEHALAFCPSEGSKGVVISHLYSDEEMDEVPPPRTISKQSTNVEKSKKAEVSSVESKSGVLSNTSSTSSTTRPIPVSHVEPMEEDYSSESSQSQDSVPSPLVKTRYGSDVPPLPVSTVAPTTKVLPIITVEPTVVSEEEEGEDVEEEVVEVPVPVAVVTKHVSKDEKKSKSKGRKDKKRRKKESKKRHRHHRKESKKNSGTDGDDSEDKNQGSDSSRSDDEKTKSNKRKRSRKDEEDVPAAKTAKTDDKKKKVSKSKKRSKKSHRKYSESDESNHTSTSEESRGSSSSSSGSESDERGKKKKKKRKRSQKKRVKEKKEDDYSSDEEPKDRSDKSGGGGASSGRGGAEGDKSRSHRKDRDKDREKDRDRKSRDQDKDKDRDRSDRKKKRLRDLPNTDDEGSSSDYSSTSITSSSSSSSSSSYTSSDSDSSNNEENNAIMMDELASDLQLSYQIAKIQQIGKEEKTENDSQILSKILCQIENDQIRSIKKANSRGEEKYDPFVEDTELDDDCKMSPSVPDDCMDMNIMEKVCLPKDEHELSGAQDLLKTFENDPLLQLVLTDQKLSAENLLANISEPDQVSVATDIMKDEAPLAYLNPEPPAVSIPTEEVLPVMPLLSELAERRNDEAFLQMNSPSESSAPKELTATDIRTHYSEEEKEMFEDQRLPSSLVNINGPRSPPYPRSPVPHDNRQRHERVPNKGSYSRSPSRSRSGSRSRSYSRSRSRSYSPDRRRYPRTRESIHERRYHPYDRRDRYRPDRRDRYDRHAGRDVKDRERGYDDRHARYDRYRPRDRERDSDYSHRSRDRDSRSPDDFHHRNYPRRYDRAERTEKARIYDREYREREDQEIADARMLPSPADLVEKPISTICTLSNTILPTSIESTSPSIVLNADDPTNPDLSDNGMLNFMNNMPDGRANWSNLKEIIPQSDSLVSTESGPDCNAPVPGYASPPKRLSLDERLEMEMGIKLHDEVPSSQPYGYGAYANSMQAIFPHAANPIGSFHASKPGWQVRSAPQVTHQRGYDVSTHVPKQSQAIPLGDVIQVLPGQQIDRIFTVTKHNSKQNPLEVQQTAVHVVRKIGDEVEPSKCVHIKVPVLPFKIPVCGAPQLEALQAAELEKENRVLLKQQKREQKRIELKRRQYEKRKAQLKKKKIMEKKKKKELEDAAKKETGAKNYVAGENPVGNEAKESTTAVDPEELKLLKEALTEIPTDGGEDIAGKMDSGEPQLLRDQILPIDDMKDADEHDDGEDNNPVSPKPTPAETSPASKPILPLKGILYITGLKSEKSSKAVKFADGILPGHGSSRSEGEDIHSPPPGQENTRRKQAAKEKKKKKKKKPLEEIDPNETLLPPPPPPKEPYPYCPLGILYQFNPPYAIVYAQTVSEHGYEVTFTPSMETPKDFAGEQLETDDVFTSQAENTNNSMLGLSMLPMPGLGGDTSPTSWSRSSKDRLRRKRKSRDSRERRDIDLKTHQVSAPLDSPSSRHSSHHRYHSREREHKPSSAHAQRIPTIVGAVSVPKKVKVSQGIRDYQPIEEERVVASGRKDSRVPEELSRENQNLISISSHQNDHTIHDDSVEVNSFAYESSIKDQPDQKRYENHRLRHHENNRIRVNHPDDRSRVEGSHKVYENHKVDHHHKRRLEQSNHIENHHLEHKHSDHKRQEYRHSGWKEVKRSDKPAGNPNLIRISPTRTLSNSHEEAPVKNKRPEERPRTPELDSEKMGVNADTVFAPAQLRGKQPIKIKMSTSKFSDISEASSGLAGDCIVGSIHVSPQPRGFSHSGEKHPSHRTPVPVTPTITVNPAIPASPKLQMLGPPIAPPVYDYYNFNNVIPSMATAPPAISPAPGLPSGIDLSRPPPNFSSSSPVPALNISGAPPPFSVATRVPDVRITNCNPSLHRPPHKANRS